VDAYLGVDERSRSLCHFAVVVSHHAIVRRRAGAWGVLLGPPSWRCGELQLTYDVLAQPGAPGISITTFSPEPGSATAEKIAMLASWAADL
jgi:hypothetical protein